MKMRASLAKIMIFGMAAVCATAIVLLIASHNGKFASRQASAGKSILAANQAARTTSAKVDPKWAEAYGKLPMSFEENRGQTSSNVRFISRGQGYELFLTPEEAVLELRDSKPLDLSPRKRTASLKALRAARQKTKTSVIRMRLAGANSKTEMAGLSQLPGRTNYFIGSDSKHWRMDLPSYARVKYSGIYPGIDLVFYGNRRQLEYDYVVSPGADPKAIALDVTGARKLRINTRGNLAMTVPGGEVELQKPIVYQEVNGERREIAANYALSGDHRVNFAVADYDRSKPLIVDPVLNYSTYLGGSDFGDEALGIAVDPVSGDAYVVGVTSSSTFPTTSANAYASAAPGGTTSIGAVFVTELNSTGTAELYSTYLGGSVGEFGFGIALDGVGNAYVTGLTLSTDYPTTASAYIAAPATNPFGSGFISVINTSQSGVSSLVYSSYLGGTNGDYGNSIAADSTQNAYVTGITYSPSISTTGAYQTTAPDGTDGNAFLTRIDTTKSGSASLIYSTYLGGTGANAANLLYADQGWGIAAGSSKAYIVGTTSSTDFPTVNGYQTNPNGGNTAGTIFVSEIDTTQTGPTSLAYSTYLSGEALDEGYAIALGQNGVAYITGSTDSLQFPITNGAFQTTGYASGVAYVSLIDTTQSGASSLKYSTFLGGNDSDSGQGIQVDSAGNAYVAGATDSLTPPNTIPNGAFPLTPGALQTNSSNTEGTAFVSEISPNGAGAADLVYSTLFGGSGDNSIPDRAFGIALDSANNAYIGGQTASTDFPAYPNPGAFQTSLTGSDGSSIASAFVAKLTLTPTVVVSPTTLSFGTVLDGTTSAAQTVTITNNTGAVVPYTLTLLGGNAADFAAVPGGGTPCGVGSLAASATPCTISVTFSPTVNGAESSNLFVGYTTFGITSSQVVTLTGTGTNLALNVSPGVLTFAGQLVTTTSAAQSIIVTNSSVSDGAVSLTNSTDFSYTVLAGSPVNCTVATTPANTTCTYSVTFNPASGDIGALASTFAVTAGANTQTATLNGTGWDFNFSPSTQTVSTAPGGTSNPTVTANFLGGFVGPVTLSCTGSIPKGSCTVPASISAPGTVTVAIATAGSSAAPPSSFRFPPISRRQVVLIGFSVLLLFTLPFARRRRSKVGLVGALVMIIGLTACSGSSGTPPGAYQLTISGTSNGVTRTATITLNVT